VNIVPHIDQTRSCKYSEGLCYVGNQQVVIWDPEEHGKICYNEFKGEYTGKRAGNYFIVDKIQGAFKTERLDENVCPGWIPGNYAYKGQGVIINSKWAKLLE